MVDTSVCLERSNEASMHIYGYNKEHDIIVYMVIKDAKQMLAAMPSFSKVSVLVRLHWNSTLKYSNYNGVCSIIESLRFQGSKMPK